VNRRRLIAWRGFAFAGRRKTYQSNAKKGKKNSGRRHSVTAAGSYTLDHAGEISSRNFASQLFKQAHPQRRVSLKGAAQGVDGQQKQRSRAYSGERISVVSVSECGCQLYKVAGPRVAQNHARIQSFSSSLKAAGDNDVQTFTGTGLAKDDLAGIDANALRRLVEQVTCLGRALQQLRKRTRRNCRNALGCCLGLHARFFPSGPVRFRCVQLLPAWLRPWFAGRCRWRIGLGPVELNAGETI
jgi:hypothetical protein